MRLFLLFILLFFNLYLRADDKIRPPFLKFENDQWVDSVFNSLTLDERIGQLIMVAAYSGKNTALNDQLIRMVKENKIGGLLAMQGTPTSHINLVNRLQKMSKTPLLVAMDAEYGLSMRLDSCIRYPYGFSLGAITNDSLIFQMGADLGKQMKRVGIHINFAPVADVNSNPMNPVIGYRSFGDDPERVSQKAIAYALGLQSQNVLATLKHFPGHGDTQSDSHFSLPVISHDRMRLDSIDLYPFQKGIVQGIGAIMTGHISVPSLDAKGAAASVSELMINKLLIGDMKFEGLVVTDAMNMSGVANKNDRDDAGVKALIAGNDLLEFVVNPEKTIASIRNAVRDGRISIEQINNKCRKILMVKRWVGLNQTVPIKTNNIYHDLNQSAYRMTLRNIAQHSLTTLRNEKQLIPLKRLDTLKIATVSIGRNKITAFQQSLGRYTKMTHFFISKEDGDVEIDKLMSQLKKYNLIVAGINNLGNFVSSYYGVTKTQQKVVQQITDLNKSVFVLFGNPYALKLLDGLKKANGLVVAYQESEETQDLAGQLLFGAFEGKGRLPITVDDHFRTSDGLSVVPINRFKYTLPEEFGVDSLELKQRIDSILLPAIKDRAFPGCQVFAAKDGKVFFNVSYGYQTYENNNRVSADHLYDLASLTKVLSPIPALMRLSDEQKFFVNKKISDYWPDWKGSNKQEVTFLDALSHQSRLKPGIFFWSKCLDEKGNFNPAYLSRDSTAQFALRVSNNLYLLSSFPDSVYAAIRKSTLLKRKQYVYSDLPSIIYPKIIERISQKEYMTYLNDTFYSPLGASTLTFNPYLHFPVDQIVPTEFDSSFRKELLQGFVHDESAAVLGGVSGNAGLFGTINDAAKVMQMFLNYGVYGGERYLSESVVREWTKSHFEKYGNRRGYGFDKPNTHCGKGTTASSYPASMASRESFGHSGFTGTFVWADPKTGILFLFFSNRIYPTRNNHLISHMRLRESTQEVFYEMIARSRSKI